MNTELKYIVVLQKHFDVLFTFFSFTNFQLFHKFVGSGVTRGMGARSPIKIHLKMNKMRAQNAHTG